MSTWFGRMLRRVLPSAPCGPTGRPRRAGDAPPADADARRAFAITQAMDAGSSHWMLSSIDLASGVEVHEINAVHPEFAAPEPGMARLAGAAS